MDKMLLIVFALTITHVCVLAQKSIFWVKKGNGGWNVPNNWMAPGSSPVNRIPNDQDTVFILHDTVFIGGSTNAFARRIELGVVDSAGSGLVVLSDAALNINDFDAQKDDAEAGLMMQNASLLNLGLIHISKTTPGIYTDFNSYVENRGEISIDSVTQFGIKASNILNVGVIVIKHVAAGYAGQSVGFSANSITNYGIINVSNACRGMSADEILNNGLIQLNLNSERGASASSLINLSKLVISNSAEGVTCDVLNNEDSIIITEVSDFGIRADDFLNETSGFIKIINSTTPSTVGLRNSTHVINFGELRIDSMLQVGNIAIDNAQDFENYGSITITDCDLGILNSDNMSNIGGMIGIQRCNLAISTRGHFKNEAGGIIEVMWSQNGIEITSNFRSMLDNSNNSTITIENTIGIPIQISADAVLVNNGILEAN